MLFLCLLRLLSSLLSLVASLSFFLCFSRGPFSFLLSFSLFLFFLLLLLLLDHCVARARICVAGDRWPFVPTSKKGEKCTHSNAHTRNHRTQCNIGNIAEGDHSSGWEMHFTLMRLRISLSGKRVRVGRGTSPRNRKCPYLEHYPGHVVDVDTLSDKSSCWESIRSWWKPLPSQNCIQTAIHPSILKVQQQYLNTSTLCSFQLTILALLSDYETTKKATKRTRLLVALFLWTFNFINIYLKGLKSRSNKLT